MANAQQIRHAIDTGAARDRVRAPDPAAAPLGTDEEAAGDRPASTFQGWQPVERGDRIADGDPAVGELYRVRGEEDNRAPAQAPPDWSLWGFIAAGLVLLGLVLALLAR